MKFLFTILLLHYTIFFQSYGQIKYATQNLKQQVSRMGEAFVRDDYKTFSTYTHPLILKLMGGTERMVAILTKSANDMKEKGIDFSNITFDEPSIILKKGKELQATIAQHTEIKLPHGRIVNTSTLIAISTDNGNNWTFIDTSNRDLAKLRKVLPNLSAAITLPPMKAPVRYDY